MISSSNYSLRTNGISIVVVGAMNPAIFQPFWFASNNLIRDEDAENAKVDIVHSQATVFACDWFSLNVTTDRFGIESRDSAKLYELRDLVLGTFAILEHTPIGAFGLNSLQHFEITTEEVWHAIGDHFAPKTSWTELFDREPRLGMRALVIEGNKSETLADRIQIRIEPSKTALPYGLHVNINQHYRFASPENGPGNVDQMVDALNTQWEGFLRFRDQVWKHIFAQVPIDGRGN